MKEDRSAPEYLSPGFNRRRPGITARESPAVGIVGLVCCMKRVTLNGQRSIGGRRIDGASFFGSAYRIGAGQLATAVMRRMTLGRGKRRNWAAGALPAANSIP